MDLVRATTFTTYTRDPKTNVTSKYLESDEESDPVELCVAFHSEWMKRAPDEVLEREVLARRQRFPVAAVVVVHNDISLMRATLEEVAVVVEHIVSVTELHVWATRGGDGFRFLFYDHPERITILLE